METSQNSSRRPMVVGIAVAIVIIIAIVIVAVVMLATPKKEAATTATKAPATPTVASKDEVSQNLSQLDSTMKQAAADQTAAKAAIKDGTNQIKVGN